jgi:hypothetical protein
VLVVLPALTHDPAVFILSTTGRLNLVGSFPVAVVACPGAAVVGFTTGAPAVAVPRASPAGRTVVTGAVRSAWVAAKLLTVTARTAVSAMSELLRARVLNRALWLSDVMRCRRRTARTTSFPVLLTRSMAPAE